LGEHDRLSCGDGAGIGGCQPADITWPGSEQHGCHQLPLRCWQRIDAAKHRTYDADISYRHSGPCNLSIGVSMHDITPIKVRDLPRFLKAIEPIAAELESGNFSIASALMRNAGDVIEATAIGAGVERAWLEDQAPDVLAELAAKVLEVNADFFVRRLPQVIQGTADRLTQSAQTASGGTSGSPPSSMPDSPTAT
jgi:hypothetical protein